MPWKLVSFLAALILAAFFIGFNLENRCDVSFVFYTFRDIPIFVSLLFAFVAGAIAVIPFFVGARIRRSSKAASAKKDEGKPDRGASPSGRKSSVRVRESSED